MANMIELARLAAPSVGPLLKISLVTAQTLPASRAIAALLCVSSMLALSACAALPADPFEPMNRTVFDFNVTVARSLGSNGNAAHDSLLTTSVINVLTNLHEPMNAINFLLQGRECAAGVSVQRFLANSTIGIGGLVDQAAEHFGLMPMDTDFGETLGSWGVPKGAYVVLPLLGPTDVRGVAGLTVEFVADPVDLGLLRAGWLLASQIKSGVELIGLSVESAEATGAIVDRGGDAYGAQRDAFQHSNRGEPVSSSCSMPSPQRLGGTQ